MILASDVVADLEFLVDDENSERYSFDKDYMPAINAAARYIMSAFDQAFERGILSPTIFGELLFGTMILPTAVSGLDASRLAVTLANMWRLVGVDPTPILDGVPNDYIAPSKSLAKYTPFDEAGNPDEDPFAAGATQPADTLRYSYTTINTDSVGASIILRPAIATPCAIVYLKPPTKVTLTSSNVEFPYVLYQPLLMKAYQYLMIQAGSEAQMSLQISDKDVKELVALFR